MGHTVLVDFADFEKHVLGIEDGLIRTANLSQDFVNIARVEFSKLFGGKSTPKEDIVGKKFVDVLNMQDAGGLLEHHGAAFTGHNISEDGVTSKVDAGLYPEAHTPTDGKPSWNHMRLFIEFKRIGTDLDPFEDSVPGAPEATAQSRKAVREQITDYALVIRNRQHRICIYALLVIGPEFRAMRFDQSGVIVTRKQSYLEDPRWILSFLAWFDTASPEEQGLDPTATLVEKGSRAYKLMTEYALAHESDMEHVVGTSVPATYPPPATEILTFRSTAPTRSPVGRKTRRSKKRAADEQCSLDDESYLDDIELERDDPRVFKYVRDKFRESLQDDWPRYKLDVGHDKRIFLVGRPIWVVLSLYGRGIRGYVALDVKRRRFAFLKDCWRPYYVDVEPEGYYLEKLNAEAMADSNIQVPIVIAHGDVRNQVTFTALYARRLAVEAKKATRASAAEATPATPSAATEWSLSPAANGGPSEVDAQSDGEQDQPVDTENLDDDSEEIAATHRVLTHYRIVVKDVCLPFTEVPSSWQLVRNIMDCILTHALAYTRLRLLHRDVSAGNVIIRPSLSSTVDAHGNRTVVWTGVLTDWELAKEVPESDATEKPKQVARQPERTGTWQFMSVAYIKHQPYQPVCVADELESFFHVLLFYAIRLLPHNIPNTRFFVADYFNSSSFYDGTNRSSSSAKWTSMHSGEINVPNIGPLLFLIDGASSQEHHLFNVLISTMLGFYRARYTVLQWEERRAKATAAGSSLPSGSSNGTRIPALTLGSKARKAAASVSNFGPSPADEEAAKMLDAHDEIVEIFKDALQDRSLWPSGDVVEDRLGKDYDPRALIIALNNMFATAAPTNTVSSQRVDGPPARKKQRTDASESSGQHSITQARSVHTGGVSTAGSFERGSRIGSTKSKGDSKGKGKARARD
ncbi:hypothetical protein BN946_scf184852.g2 [Trametes cinnabarina]|uniref:Fungal-type protein kinase domain-containing protein n=1 Tax=Pycnoporus cinnabarinus TaxID=5643 RepID=A0A060SQN4_PYCCI|nr:hypothetical protein BN946_scf184852.g2 [Trametes cinnabarina]